MRKLLMVCQLVAGCLLCGGMSGCSNFFPALDNGGSGNSGSGSGTGVTGTGPNAAYVLNQTTQSVAGFTLGTSGLTAVGGISLGFTPLAAVVSRPGTWLYVAGPGQIYRFGINTSTGSLSVPSTGSAAALATVSALEVSPDGRWLFGLETLSQQVDLFAINADGTLTPTSAGTTGAAGAPFSVASGTVVPKQLVMAPSGAYLFAALGTAGEVVFTFNTTNGNLFQSQVLGTGSVQTGDQAIAVDATSSYLYVLRAGTNAGLNVFTIGSQGMLSSIAGSPYGVGAGPAAVVSGPSSKYVYVANRTDGTISEWTVGTGGALTAVSGSPVATGSLVSSLGLDSTGKYLLAANFGGSPDVAMFGFDGTVAGKLQSIATAAAGTDPAGSILVVMTH